MTISGFTMGRNVTKLYYPAKESIMSILPIVDEFVVALGKGDEDDRTREEIESIGSDKVKIIETEWKPGEYPRGGELARQTDIAKDACSGDWLFYLQADEVVHEDDHAAIVDRCTELLDDREVEGLLFNYLHFWGDYDHYHNSHGWYPHEIRIIRNDPDIHSWESAQSFRHIPGFDRKNYHQVEGTRKLRVAPVDARIFHYGWVRPPSLMQTKKVYHDTIHHGDKADKSMLDFDYGRLDKIARYTGTHPAVMREKMQDLFWKESLNYGDKPIDPNRALHKHEQFKYRLVTFIEQKILGGKHIGEFKNYELLQR